MADFPIGSVTKVVSGNIGTLTRGVDVVSSTTANTVGAKTELIASTDYDSNSIAITLTRASTGSNSSYLMNIYIGGAGVEELLIEGIHFCADPSQANWQHQVWNLPLNIPKGSRISADCQTNQAAADTATILTHFSAMSFESHTGYGKCESFGANTATSNSSIVVDSGGTIHAKGAWTEIAASSDGFKGFMLSIGSNLNAGMDNTEWLFDVGIGSAGNENVIVENIFAISTASEECWNDTSFKGVEIPSGTRIAIRSQSDENNTTDRLRSVIFHGVR